MTSSKAASQGDESTDQEVDPPVFLVATDGSDPALHAGERAVLLARGLRAKLFILNALDTRETIHAGVHREQVTGELARRGKEAIGKIAAMAEQHGVDHDELLVEGHPSEAILATADEVEADYVFLGAEGMSRAEHVVLGSVSQEVLRSAVRPVVLLVGGGRPPDDPVRRRVEEKEALPPPPELRPPNYRPEWP